MLSLWDVASLTMIAFWSHLTVDDFLLLSSSSIQTPGMSKYVCYLKEGKNRDNYPALVLAMYSFYRGIHSNMSLYLTIIRRRRGEYCRIIPETKSRGLFDNIHRA